MQFRAAQAGLVLLVLGFVARALGAGCFVVNIWRTMDASPIAH